MLALMVRLRLCFALEDLCSVQGDAGGFYGFTYIAVRSPVN